MGFGHTCICSFKSLLGDSLARNGPFPSFSFSNCKQGILVFSLVKLLLHKQQKDFLKLQMHVFIFSSFGDLLAMWFVHWTPEDTLHVVKVLGKPWSFPGPYIPIYKLLYF